MNRFRTLDTEEERAMMERAAYLEAYAERRNLPVRLYTAVDQLERDGSRYVVRQPSALGRHPDRAEGSAMTSRGSGSRWSQTTGCRRTSAGWFHPSRGCISSVCPSSTA